MYMDRFGPSHYRIATSPHCPNDCIPLSMGVALEDWHDVGDGIAEPWLLSRPHAKDERCIVQCTGSTGREA